MPPRLVIVGRPNVGKSSLLNVLAGRKVSIVDPTAGVTRDRVATDIELPPDPKAGRDGEPVPAVLIDTGGVGIVDRQDLSTDIEQQVAEGLAEADVVIFMVDAQQGVTPLDQKVANLLRSSGAKSKPIVFIANKVDGSGFEADAWETMQLGFGEPVMFSAVTRHNLHDLFERLHRAIADAPQRDRGGHDVEATDGELKIALVGKRNAGKSTLLNALAGQQRVIVSEKEGTTRDSIDVRIAWPDRSAPGGTTSFLAIDTAGVRRTRSLDGDIEFYSQHRSLRSVRRADVCLLLIDSTVPISQTDHLLTQEIQKHFKPVVIVVNKWDLAKGKMEQEQYVEYLEDALKGLTFAPVVFISAKEGDGLKEAVALAYNLHEQAGHRMGTGELNRFFERVYAERGPGTNKHGKQPRLFYATQPTTHPPTLALFVNDEELFDHNYQRYLMNRIRDELPFSEVPIKLLIRGKPKMTAEERKAAKLDD
ncbi:MAG: ribosome biogenesis GTPase Der [Planctomycetota bacterium]